VSATVIEIKANIVTEILIVTATITITMTMIVATLVTMIVTMILTMIVTHLYLEDYAMHKRTSSCRDDSRIKLPTRVWRLML
jgi:hypothetical protein